MKSKADKSFNRRLEEFYMKTITEKMIIVDLLCEYAKESNWNADGSPSNDDSYYKVVQINKDTIK